VSIHRLSLSDHVAAVRRSGYYQLQQLRPVVWCSSEDAAKTTVGTFVISRLDYCNALPAVSSECCRQTRDRHQAMRSYLACALPTALASCGSASCSRLQLSSTGPCPVTPRVTWPTTVRSSPTPVSDNYMYVLPILGTIVVSRTRSSFGDRTFAAAGPQIWNSLPPNLRLCCLLAVIRPVQAVTEDIFIRTVRPQRSVNGFNCAE